jgi:hypothetical protein
MNHDKREIYSIADFEDILRGVLEEELGLGDAILETLQEEVRKEFRYVNWIRFKATLCGGCVAGPEECDVAYGRQGARGVWKRIVNGEKFSKCPCRVNGTILFDTAEGTLQEIDLSENEAYNVVEQLDPIE